MQEGLTLPEIEPELPVGRLPVAASGFCNEVNYRIKNTSVSSPASMLTQQVKKSRQTIPDINQIKEIPRSIFPC